MANKVATNMTIVEDWSENTPVPMGRQAPLNLADDLYNAFSNHMVQLDHRILTSASSNATIDKDIFAEFVTKADPTPLGEKIRKFRYLHGNLIVKVVVQGQPFAAGQIVMSFTPRVFAPNFSTVTHVPLEFNRVNSKIVPHIIIDPSKSTTYEISLPCPNPTGFYDISQTTIHGSYQCDIIIFNSLISGTAVVPSLSICTYACLDKPIFGGLTLAADYMQTEKTSSLSSYMMRAANISENLGMHAPALEPATTLFSSFTSTIGKALSFFGFAKSLTISQVTVPFTRHADNYSQFDGISNAISLSGTQANSIGISPSIGGGKMEEMSIAHITSIKGLVAQFSIPNSGAAGDYINGIWLCPATTWSQAAAQVSLTPLAGVAACFDFWTGDIIVTVEVVASVFHRSTILVAWDPFTGTQPTFANAIATLQTTTISISGNTTVDILVPYVQPEAYKDLPVSTVGNVYTTAQTNGRIHFFIVNPTTSNGSVDPLQFNVYLSSSNVKFNASTTELLPKAKLTLLADFSPVTKVSFGKASNTAHSHLKMFGESYESIKQLTSKNTGNFFGLYDVPANDPNLGRIMQMYNVPIVDYETSQFAAGTTVQSSFLSWFAAAFVGYRGGIKYASHPHANNPALLYKEFSISENMTTGGQPTALASNNVWIPIAYNNAAERFDSYAFTFHNLVDNPMYDFAAPILCSYDFAPCRNRITACTNQVRTYANQAFAPTTTGFQSYINVTTASADDAVFINFVGFPTVVAT